LRILVDPRSPSRRWGDARVLWMDQMADQTRTQIPGRFKPGVSGNPSGMEGRLTKAQRTAQRDAKMAELAGPLGGLEVLNALERERVKWAAELLLQRPARHDDRVRAINSSDRLLRCVEASVRKRRGRTAGPSFQDALANRGPKP